MLLGTDLGGKLLAIGAVHRVFPAPNWSSRLARQFGRERVRSQAVATPSRATQKPCTSSTSDPQLGFSIASEVKIGGGGEADDLAQKRFSELGTLIADYELGRDGCVLLLSPAVAAQRIEAILPSFFASARLDVPLEQNHQIIAEANEWFDVPLSAIDEAIELVNAEAISSYEHDGTERRIRLR